ncbi:Flp pilus assembly protein CpaB [Photobacterium sp. DNB23_23_1]|uniref:Flp pilus assembly protein CpaB n=1 Tax=Photobacterium pectinilyticum TaxID=2906793 RepID=A0ABT1N2C8_9GAMM|nr:Flp pilus assembly protein CpaB [Photobacterium sp. ZSDE20]MCQ1058864.1 Flp pilus assembly protein CpaB [Photobacterium sp. ZSDE20]MDD1823846.1 Flp pilus assembly protein CpaB [Photobacterium sp. ZSDE20]
MSKVKILLMLSISIFMGLGALFLANNWIEKKQAAISTNPPVTVEPERIEVIKEEPRVPRVVAQNNIPLGTPLEAKHVKLEYYPEDLVINTGFSSITEVIGKLARNEIFAGDLLRNERLVSPGEGTTLAALISPKMRAVTIRVNDVIGVAGFLLPGDYVDVISAQKSTSRAQTVLKKIKILAVDQTARTDESKPIIVRAVTLELTPRQAESLITSKSKGELQLSLRNPNDPEEKPRVYRRTTDSVTIIKGTDTSRVNVRI